MDTGGSPHSYSGNNLESGANLTSADLSDAYLDIAYLDDATFSPGTTLKDGQTVAQYGFDAASLQTYLEAFPVYASSPLFLNVAYCAMNSLEGARFHCLGK